MLAASKPMKRMRDESTSARDRAGRSSAGAGLPSVTHSLSMAPPERSAFLERIESSREGAEGRGEGQRAALPAVPAAPTRMPAASPVVQAFTEAGEERAPEPTLTQRMAASRSAKAFAGAPGELPGLGAAGVLPYQAKMEAGFGTSLRGVQAFFGPEARAATGALGKRAFAVGQAIAFAEAEPPELVVAHEVAHTLQQRGGAARVSMFGGPADPLELEADAAAHEVVGGGRAVIRGHVIGAQVQGFSATAYLSSLATQAKKKVYSEIRGATGYDVDKNVFDADLDPGKAVHYLQSVPISALRLEVLESLRLDKASKGSNPVHLHIDFAAETAQLTANYLKLEGITNAGNGFSSGEIVVNSMVVDIAAKGDKLALGVGSVRVRDAMFKEYRLGYPTVRTLSCDEVLLPPFNVDAENVSGTYGWVLGVRLAGAKITGLRYPGLPPVNVVIANTVVSLDQIGSSLAPPSDSAGLLKAEVPGVLPADGRIDVVLTGVRAAVSTGDARGTGYAGVAGFDVFMATAFAADGRELANVTVEGFRGRGSAAAKAASGHIDRLELRGAPAFVQALLHSEPVYAKAADAIAVLKAAGIGPGIGTNLVLSDVELSGEGDLPEVGRVKARADLAITVTVPEVGQLAVDLRGFYAKYRTDGSDGFVEASFEKFTAKLTGSPDRKTTQELASVELADARGYVMLAGDKVGGGGETTFTVRGDLGAMISAFNDQLRGLPRPIRKILPVLQQLGVRADQVAGKVRIDASKDGAFTVGGDLEVAVAVNAGKVAVKLAGFKAGSTGLVTTGSFSSFRAKLLTKGDKEAASVFAEGVRIESVAPSKTDEHGVVEGSVKPPGEELGISKLVIAGDAGGLATIAGALARGTSALPPKVRRICNLVARNVVAAKGTVTLTGVRASLDDEGRETVRAELAARVELVGVGSLQVKVVNFRERGDTKGGAVHVGFDRLEATLRDRNDNEAAFFAAEADLAAGLGGSGQDFGFKARKIEARGDSKGIDALIAAAQINLKILPPDIQRSFAAVREFQIVAKGELRISDLEVQGKAGDIHAKGELSAGFDVAGVGKVGITIKGFRGDVTKTSSIVHFDSFVATLTGTPGTPLASFEVAGKPGAAGPDFQRATVRASGEPDKRVALAQAIRGRVNTLPPQVVKGVDVALKALAAGTELKVEITDTDLGVSDGRVVARGQLSVALDVPGVGKVQLKLIGKDAADGSADTSELTGFKSLDLEVLDKSGGQVMYLGVRGASIGADKKSFKTDYFELRGDGTLLHRLVAEDTLKLFPADVAPKLALLARNRLNLASATKLSVQEDASGRVAADAETLTAVAAVHFVDGAKIYEVPEMVLSISNAKVRLNDKRELESVVGAKVAGFGRFTYTNADETIEGNALLTTGAFNARFPGQRAAAAGQKVAATAQQVKAVGNVTRKTSNKPKPKPTPEEKAASNATLVESAGMLRTASVGTSTPIMPGRYGGKWAHIDVARGTRLRIELWVADGKITSARMEFAPAIELDGVDIRGASIEVMGKLGEVRTDVNWFVDAIAYFADETINDAILGQNTMPLDLKKLVQGVITKHMDPKATTDEGKADEPKLADLSSKGMDYGGTTGSVYAEVAAAKDTTVAGVTVPAGSGISLVGSSIAGAPINLKASAMQLAFDFGGNRIDMAGLKAGLDVSRDFRNIGLGKFEIETFDLNGGVTAEEALKPAPVRDGGFAFDPSGGARPARPMFGDLGSLGVDVKKPLLGDLGAAAVATAVATAASEETAVRTWLAEHRLDVGLTARMPGLITRVRLEVGKLRPSLVIASDQRILDLLHTAAKAVGVRLPADELPTTRTEAEIKAATEQGLLAKFAVSVTREGGRFNVVAMGATPALVGDGAQLAIDSDGVRYQVKDSASRINTTLQATTDMGLKFSTAIGEMSFTAGIDPNQWQIGLSFGPEAPALASLPTIFANAQRALGAAASGVLAGDKTSPKALYDAQVSPHMPAIKTALAAAKATAAIQPGKVSFGISATGPGYQPFAVEGAVQGITVKATLSVTF